HFDEIATYTIELSPDLPAWKYQDQAFAPERLAEILKESREYLKRFDVFAHSGQQDDNTMMSAEQQRRNLRQRKAQGTPATVSSSASLLACVRTGFWILEADTLTQAWPKRLLIDFHNGSVVAEDVDGGERSLSIGSPEAFEVISAAYLRAGWDNKYVYSFTWL